MGIDENTFYREFDLIYREEAYKIATLFREDLERQKKEKEYYN